MMRKLFKKPSTFMPIIIEKKIVTYGLITHGTDHAPALTFFQTFPLNAGQFIGGKIINQYFFVQKAHQIAYQFKLTQYLTALACPMDEKIESHQLFGHILFLINIGMPCTFITDTEKLYTHLAIKDSDEKQVIQTALLELYNGAQREL